MIKTVLWDLDGTLLDFKAAQYVAIKECFKKFNLGECTDEMISVYSAINAKYWEALERGEMTKPQILVERFVEFFDLYGINKDVIPEFEDEYQIRLGDTVSFFPNALETVRALKGKVNQFLVTNGTKVTQDRKLKNSGLGEYFDKLYISELVGAEKPSAAFFDAILLENPGLSKDEMIIIGDSLTSDMKGGNNFNIKTCWYNPCHLTNDKNVHIDIEIDDLSKITEIVLAKNS